MKNLHRLPENFNSQHEEEVSAENWDPSMEHDVFMYSDEDDAPVFKEQFMEHALLRVEIPRRRVRC